MIAFVRGVMAASTRSGSMQKSSSRTSTNTGRAPDLEDRADGRVEREADRDHLVAGADAAAPRRTASWATVPLAISTAWRTPQYAAHASSNSAVCAAHREHAGAEDLEDGLLLGRSDVRLRDRDHAELHRHVGDAPVAVDLVPRSSSLGHTAAPDATAAEHACRVAILQALPAGAHPAERPRRVAGDERVVRDVAGHDGARPDRGEAADVVAGDDDRPGPDRRTRMRGGSGSPPSRPRARARRSA